MDGFAPTIKSMDFPYASVSAAATTVARHLPPTPMWSYPVLNAAVGATVHVKHENTQPIGAFKARGALTLMSSLTGGTVTYSTGNHAQAMAWASHLYDLPCTVVMPEDANPSKVAAVRAWGASVVLTGAVLADAEAHAVELAAATGQRLVSPGDTPELLAGVGTLYVEILTARPDLSAILVPVGSGTGLAAATVVARELAPGCEVIGVQSTASPAAHDAWRSGAPCTRPNRTLVEGLSTGRSYDLPQQIMRGASPTSSWSPTTASPRPSACSPPRPTRSPRVRARRVWRRSWSSRTASPAVRSPWSARAVTPPRASWRPWPSATSGGCPTGRAEWCSAPRCAP
jgi:threonine dehydratase